MNSKLIILGMVLGALPSPVLDLAAQSANANSAAGANRGNPVLSRLESFEQGVAAAKARNLNEAESRLQATNESTPNSGAWYLETGQRLGQVAAALTNRRDRASARETAMRAVTILQTAESKLLGEGKRGAAAHAQQVIGSLSEHILKDFAAAKAAYQKAVLNDPTREGGRSGVERVQEKKQGGSK